MPPSALVTTSTGCDGPTALAIGTTVSWWLAGDRAMAPRRSNSSAPATSLAQPSATAAARMERCNGSGASP